jgi:hypothetical protein
LQNNFPHQPNPPVPREARPPRGARVPPLRPEDARENTAIRGDVVRAGAQIMPSVWED